MSDFEAKDNKRPNPLIPSPNTDWEALLQDSLPSEVDRRSPGNLADLFTDAERVFVYTRAQALADGTLVDVSEMAKEAGFLWPVAVTAALWRDIATISEEYQGFEDVQGRLWDVLFMGFHSIRAATDDGSQLLYKLILHTGGNEEYVVKLICGPGDQGEPVMTLMKPEED